MRKQKQSIKAWLEKAETDWKVVDILVQSKEGLWGVVCFHVQQAVEKWLKAYLVFCGETPKRTHDLVSLLDEARRFDPALERYAGKLQVLSRFAVALRYPGNPDPTEIEGRAMVRSAQNVRKAILLRIQATPDAGKGKTI